MTRKAHAITWEETHGYVDLEDRYSVCSGALDDPDDVLEWCLTGSLAKAKKAFKRIKHRAELGVITLQDRYTDTTMKRVDHRCA